MESEKENGLTPERVMQVLKKKGTHITIEEAETILALITKIAHMAVNQYLRGCL